MKLYSENRPIPISSPKPVIAIEDLSIDKECLALNEHVKAYRSLNTVQEQVSLESYSFIDKHNYVLYNEYIKSITSNLGIAQLPIISQENIQELSTVVLNHHISLEGFIATIWEKIKKIFKGIYEKIKGFFVRFFTRLGRLKGKLKNLDEALSGTNKDIQKVNLDKVPSGLATKYPLADNLTGSDIIEVFNNVNSLQEQTKVITSKAKEFAAKDVLDKNFIEEIKKLKDSAKAAGAQIDGNNQNKKSGIVFKEAKFGEDGKANKELDKENKSLAQVAKDSEEEADTKTGEVDAVVGKNTDALSSNEDVQFQAVQKELIDFSKTVSDVLNKVKGKNLVGGIVYTSITVEQDGNLKIEDEKKDVKPSSISLTERAVLSKLVKDTIKVVENAEKDLNVYGTVNDSIMKNTEIVDKLIADLDKMGDDPSFSKYKTVLSNKVKVRLGLLKTFFSEYNKVGNTMFGMVLDTADGNVAYATLCLKFFN